MKKYILSAILALAAAFFGFGAGRITAPVEASVPVSAIMESDPLEEFRTEREQLRAMQRSQLNDIIYGVDTQKDIIAMAQRQLVKICDSEEMENTLEWILRLRGYEDCVVTVHNDCVNVMVRTDIITQQDSSLILDHVCRESGVLSGNVKIIPIK